MERKLFLLESIKNEEVAEKKKEIEALEEEQIELKKKVGYYEGEGLKELTFWELTDIENNLLEMFTKVKKRKTELLEEKIALSLSQDDNPYLCHSCEKNDFSVVNRPCGHLCLCQDCVYQIMRCPVCNMEIEFYDRIFIPE